MITNWKTAPFIQRYRQLALRNEAQSTVDDTKKFYKAYVSGMTRERLGREFTADSHRLKQLYKEATGEGEEATTGQQIPAYTKILRLFSSLGQRLNPTRRLIFGISLLAFLTHGLFAGLFADMLQLVSFLGLMMLLLVELLEKTDVKREIDLAREIQLSLLPASQHIKDTLEIQSFANTAQEVGGDYVDIITTEKGTYLVIADVAGKGLTAALYMVRLQAMVHLLIEKHSPSPKELFVDLNNYIKSDQSDKTFVTACAAFFPKEGGYFDFARAGHNPPIYYKRSEDTTEQLRSNGFALGMTGSSQMESFLTEEQYTFNKGDSILFYTDGLTEARNELNQEFGEERLISIMDIYGSLHAKSIVLKVQSSLEAFIGEEKPPDDITYTCVRAV